MTKGRMSHKIFLSKDGKYIVCEVTGLITLEVLYEFASELNSFSRATGVKRLLHDVRDAINVMNISKNYQYAYEDMEALNLQRDVRSVILVDPADKSHDFMETVSLNAGYNVRIFHNEAAAISWLNEETDYK
jgi:hypothetical protein